MPWFKLEDSFYNHPKVNRAGNAPTGLWVRCGTYSAQYLLDGHIPVEVARTFGTARQISTLVEVGLWLPCEDDDGYVMPDYLDYNPSKDQVLADRAAARERQNRKRRNDQGKFS